MSQPTENLIGIIAGEGDLPLAVGRAIENSGKNLLVIAFEGITSNDIDIPGREVLWMPFGRLQQVLDSLNDGGVKELVLSGRIGITSIFDPSRFDGPLLKLLASLKDHRGNTILAGIAQVFSAEGFRVLSNIEAAPDLITPVGLVAGREPGNEQLADIRFGWGIARELARLDVGQTVVVKGRSVVAVESMEGTDETILRAGQLAPGNLVAVKVASPDHDFRFDVPTVGIETVRSLSKTGGGILAVESGRSFLMDRDELSRICDEAGVSVVGVDEGFLGVEP